MDSIPNTSQPTTEALNSNEATNPLEVSTPLQPDVPVEASTPAAAPDLAAKVVEILRDSPTPLAVGKIKSALKKDGIKLPGKSSEHEAALLGLLAELKAEGKAFQHGPDDAAKYAATPPLAEQILKQFSATETKTFDELLGELGSAEKNAVTKVVKQLISEGKLHTHGKGKTLAYGTFAPPPPPPPPPPVDEQILTLLGSSEKKSLADVQLALEATAKPAVVKKTIAQLVESGKLFEHGKGKTLEYATFAPPPLPPPPPPVDEQILKLFGASDKKSLVNIQEALASSSKPAIVKKTILQLVEEGKLHAHGKGKAVEYATFAEPQPEWYELARAKKPFDALIKAAQKVLELEDVTLEKLLSALQVNLKNAPVKAPVSSPKSEAAVPAPVSHAPTATTDLRTALKKAYDQLCLFVEFQDKLVELPRLYHETKRMKPDLKPIEFKDELWKMGEEWLIELKIINDVRGVIEPELGISKNDDLYYYARWK